MADEDDKMYSFLKELRGVEEETLEVMKKAKVTIQCQIVSMKISLNVVYSKTEILDKLVIFNVKSESININLILPRLGLIITGSVLCKCLHFFLLKLMVLSCICHFLLLNSF